MPIHSSSELHTRTEINIKAGTASTVPPSKMRQWCLAKKYKETKESKGNRGNEDRSYKEFKMEQSCISEILEEEQDLY